jgi:indole-3-glycerol phosphate synthase
MTGTILDTILATKRDEVAAAKRRSPFAEIDAAAWAAGPARGLQRALATGARGGRPPRVLAEIKRASPSAGPIRPGADPGEIAAQYERGGAAAISVLTDRSYFDGDLGFLAAARASCTLPLLRKDFVIDAYQVAEARAAGADGVLLIVAALAPVQLGELLAAARGYGLDALVEVHDRAEADVAIAAGATLLGVNHRDLRTFAMDMTLTARIEPHLPAGAVVVAESGIKTAADARALRADAILVGEALMRAASPERALAQLVSELG